MFDYISKEQKEGFKTNYKYSCIDDSPLSIYITKPLWTFSVKFCPRWIAPNLLTVLGFTCTILQFLLLTLYDYNFTNAQDRMNKSEPIPAFIWYTASLFQYLSYMLDGIDGMQARRTGTGSPLGEIMDHGFDSWTCSFTMMALFSCIGYSDVFHLGLSYWDMFYMIWALQLCFFTGHWEKLISGTLYLPWSFDASICTLIILYFFTGFLGVNSQHMWTFEVDNYFNLDIEKLPFRLTTVSIFKILYYVVSSATIIHDITKTIRRYGIMRSDQKNQRLRSVSDLAKPWISILCAILLLHYWNAHSYDTITFSHPRLILFLSGTVFANILCRILIFQASKTKATPTINPVVLIIAMCYFLDFNQITSGVTAWSLAGLLCLGMHVHFGWNTIQILSGEFGIWPFSTIKRTANLKNQ